MARAAAATAAARGRAQRLELVLDADAVVELRLDVLDQLGLLVLLGLQALDRVLEPLQLALVDVNECVLVVGRRQRFFAFYVLAFEPRWSCGILSEFESLEIKPYILLCRVLDNSVN